MKKCLVVDDSKVVRKIIKKNFENFDFQVREAVDGKDAIAKCVEEIPDCIMLDWNMPIMNGLEFLKVFRQNKNTQSTIVIFCTTEHEVHKIQEALANGADEYIMKPFDTEILKEKLIQTGLL